MIPKLISKQEAHDRRVVERITDLVSLHDKELLSEFEGLNNFVEWIRNLDTTKLYIKIKED